jgi:N-methylhydantoinase A/oxoprolinase/acetone carboxylase beta subunit
MWIAEAWRPDAPVYDLADVLGGVAVAGPAAVKSPFTTVVLHPGDVATTTPGGDLLVELAD